MWWFVVVADNNIIANVDNFPSLIANMMCKNKVTNLVVVVVFVVVDNKFNANFDNSQRLIANLMLSYKSCCGGFCGCCYQSRC